MPKRPNIDNLKLLNLEKRVHLQKLTRILRTLCQKRFLERNGQIVAKKQSSDPGFFQHNYLKKIAVKNQDDWEKVRVIPWGGQYRTSSGDSLEIINSCSVDPPLQMLYMFYTLNIQEMRKLFEMSLMKFEKSAKWYNC